MYFSDHHPPHFHVYYGDHEAIIAINTLEVMQGNLPQRALALVLEWAVMNRAGLLDNWEKAQTHEPLISLPPLL